MMEKFEEYFRTTKHYENMLLDIARNQLSVSVFDKNGRKYRNHIVQTAYEVFQHQQVKVEELQNNINLLNEALDIKEQLNQKLREREDELQKQLSEYIFVAETIDEMYVKEVQKSDELQKRVDAALKLIESWNEIAFDKTTHWTEGYEEGCYHCAAQLEQALKGEG
ncbi:hypothetical protein ABTO95_07245 [Acinetobacter baumannii]